jgi:predicted acyltransferase
VSATAPPATIRAPRGALTPPRGAATPAPARERLLSLDVFRGLTIAGMLLVNNPGSWAAIYDPLEHARWHGWTPTDLIFPFFLFIVGITTHLSLQARRARGDGDGTLARGVLRRGLLIIGLGLLLAAFPFFPAERLTHLRIPGVLQRIGVCYLAVALLSLRATLRQQLVLVAVLLLGYWGAMTLLPVPGEGAIGAALLDQPPRTMAAWVDRALLDGHLWAVSRTWDPEGVLATLPAIGTTLLGLFAARWLAAPRPLAERINGLFAVGALAMMVGLIWHWVFPINKSLWTSSYVVFTAGMAGVVLATCMWVIDDRRVTWWTKPFVVFGTNAILAFAGSAMLARLMYSVVKVPYGGTEVPVQRAIYESAYASWIRPAELASLAFALSVCGVWLGILWVLYRKRVFLRI